MKRYPSSIHHLEYDLASEIRWLIVFGFTVMVFYGLYLFYFSTQAYADYNDCLRSFSGAQAAAFPDRVSKVEHCRAVVTEAPAVSFWDEGVRHDYPAISR